METTQKALFVDASTGFYRVRRYKVGDYFGPVDLGLHISGRTQSLNFGVGLFAGSILPGSNRLVFTGFSPCWRSFYVSSMGGAGLVFDNLGINLVSLVGKAALPSVLYLNRLHGEEIEVEIQPVDLRAVWAWPGAAALARGAGLLGGDRGPGAGASRAGAYALMDYALERFGARFEGEHRAFAVGPAAASTDFGGILSAPVKDGRATDVDTWAGRGGLGSKMLQEHGIAAVVYGGTVVDEDFRDRKVADEWFEAKYKQKLAVKDFEATTKYRFDPKFETGGTLGVNYAQVGGRLLAFNYRTVSWSEAERLALHERLILGHYLKQFNEETIAEKSQATCGEPCSAVCKKLRGEFKKDYEPYQALGPLCGVFDQRAAEALNRASDAAGFDAISLGGVLAWLMDCLDSGELKPEELGVAQLPRWEAEGFEPVSDSAHNAALGLALVDSILARETGLDLSEGPRKWGRALRRKGGARVLDRLVYAANGRRGWMVPNQYWTPGVLAPMAIMGKYYMHYGPEFLPPRELGRACAERLKKELGMDDAGLCRFHRAWGEEMMGEAIGSVYGLKEAYLAALSVASSRINSRNSAVYWESSRNVEFLRSYLARRREVEGDASPELARWIADFESDPAEAALSFWFEMRKGIDESLRDFL
ncbi:MAG TPA: aldehyde ferredoxin oxidoreductase N-terminal domain-containing protein [Spirochaetia bacterium]|nr:aldehyde ferredoxin oxidoreductase N-terminal domain-containing protein [Spirochaetia bacterium]HRZ65131.1 aldehyde ferredoxin oxidoreductase N-terminal domain-containing protein [Spirochaetia bacterium]